MSLANRAAQFAPFAALNGHEEAIAETGRLTSSRCELSADEQSELSRRLSFVVGHLADCPQLTFVVFRPDSRKSGGCYETVSGVIRKFDPYDRLITLEDGTLIPIDQILSILGDILADQ